MESVYDHKIAALEAMIDANADDVNLVSAYRAKIAKERGGAGTEMCQSVLCVDFHRAYVLS